MSAKWHQYLFTSCPGGAGLQIHSRSAGLSKEELAVLSTAQSYEPPPSAIAEPTDAQLAGFPVKHGFLRFPTGRYGVFRSQYVGRESTDADARYGNYVVEAFVREEGPLPDYPVLYMDSPSFRDARAFRDAVFAESGDLDRPLPLKDLEAEAVRARPGLSEADLRDAFRKHGELYAGLLVRLIRGETLVLEGVASADVLAHLECLQTALPLHMAHQVTAVTYTQSSTTRDLFAFQATAEPLLNYVRQDFKLKPECVCFDPADEVPADEFTRFVVRARQTSWKEAKQFFDVLSLLNQEELTGKLDDALLLWCILKKPAHPCNAEAFGRALAFGQRAGTRPFFERALESFYPEYVPAEFSRAREFDKSLAVFQFLNTAPVRQLPRQPDARLRFFCETSAGFLFTSEPQRATELVRAMLGIDSSVAGALLATDRRCSEWIRASLAAVSEAKKRDAVLRACFQSVIEVVAQAPGGPADSWRRNLRTDDWTRVFADVSLRTDFTLAEYFEGVLAPAKIAGLLLLAEVLAHWQGDEAAGRLKSAVFTYFDSLPSTECDQQTQTLLAAGYEMFAIELMSRKMRESPERTLKTLESLLQVPGLPDTARAQFLESAIVFLEESQDVVSLEKVITTHAKHLVGSNLDNRAMEAVGKGFPPPPWTPQHREALQRIKRVADQHKMVIPWRLVMIIAWSDPKRFPPDPGNGSILRGWVDEIESRPGGPGYAAYPAYAAYLLESLWPKIKTEQQMEAVGKNICLSRQVDFVKVYTKFLDKNRPAKMRPDELVKLVRFTDFIFRGREECWKDLRESLRKNLAAVSSATFSRMYAKLDCAHPQLSNTWDNILGKALDRIQERESHSVVKRVGRLFGGIAGLFGGNRKRKKF